MMLKCLALSLRLMAADPVIDFSTAYAHVAAAYTVSTDSVSPELLLAIAYFESRFDPTTTSRVEGKLRRTGSYPSTVAPASLNPRASLYCGPLQTFESSWSGCLAARSLPVAYASGVAELTRWLADRRVRGRVDLALAGHGCGNLGVTTGKCNGYPSRVLTLERRLRPERAARTTTATRVIASS